MYIYLVTMRKNNGKNKLKLKLKCGSLSLLSKSCGFICKTQIIRVANVGTYMYVYMTGVGRSFNDKQIKFVQCVLKVEQQTNKQTNKARKKHIKFNLLKCEDRKEKARKESSNLQTIHLKLQHLERFVWLSSNSCHSAKHLIFFLIIDAHVLPY